MAQWHASSLPPAYRVIDDGLASRAQRLVREGPMYNQRRELDQSCIRPVGICASPVLMTDDRHGCDDAERSDPSKLLLPCGLLHIVWCWSSLQRGESARLSCRDSASIRVGGAPSSRRLYSVHYSDVVRKTSTTQYFNRDHNTINT